MHRVDVLQVLKNYLHPQNKNDPHKADIPAAFRGLGNCENYSILNDGLSMINNIHGWKLCQYKYAPHYASLLAKLFDSKMESHVENALTLLLGLAKGISNAGFATQ